MDLELDVTRFDPGSSQWVAVKAAVERPGDRLRGWAYRTRTGESVRGLPDWICVTTWPQVGASPAAETLHVRADGSLG